ncbi:MAG: UbiH/UbiF/VisC/COQ6 family ubiquinone biosynthesis hydroxylase [Gammaproteobacteria bacterium]|nr:UbiH/UbiF/VisC/COQ6 family ubiquinone biosynthesis hydroxylase [Gammaproteobacteria bacterium]
MQHDYDMIIVGANIVGSTLACALADSSLKLLVIDGFKPEPDWPNNSYDDTHDLRVSALTSTSSELFEKLGIWQNLIKDRPSPFRALHVWNEDANNKLSFDSADTGEAYLGHIVENRRVQQALHQALAYRRSVELKLGISLATLTIEKDKATITTSDKKTITTKLIVGADGARSKVRDLSNISTNSWSYQQQAIIANVKTEKSHQQCGWQRFLATGPLALLPLADGRCSIVWSAQDAYANELMAMDKETFASEMTTALQNELGQITLDSERAAFPLKAQHANNYVAPRIALIGDAAHSIHPLAGQGVNLGLLDAACLAEIINTALENKRDIGREQTLKKYQRARKTSNLAMLTATDGLNKLFSNNNDLLNWARNTGFATVNAMPKTTSLFMRLAAGK